MRFLNLALAILVLAASIPTPTERVAGCYEFEFGPWSGLQDAPMAHAQYHLPCLADAVFMGGQGTCMSAEPVGVLEQDLVAIRLAVAIGRGPMPVAIIMKYAGLTDLGGH